MAPKKRASEVSRLLADTNVQIIEPTVDNVPTTRRLTRSLTRPTGDTTAPPSQPPARATPKAKGKAKAKTTAASGGSSSSQPSKSSSSTSLRIVIEHCTSDQRFLKKATEVQEGIQAAALHGVNEVVLNPEGKSRAGCFEISMDPTGHTFISRVGLKKPYKELKDIKVDEVVESIAKYLKSRKKSARINADNN